MPRRISKHPISVVLRMRICPSIVIYLIWSNNRGFKPPWIWLPPSTCSTSTTLDLERVTLGVKDELIKADKWRVGEDEIEILEDFGKQKTVSVLELDMTTMKWILQGGLGVLNGRQGTVTSNIPWNVIIQRSPKWLRNIIQLGKCFRWRPLRILQHSFKSLPGIVLPSRVAG